MTLRELEKLFPNLIVFLNENHFENEFDDFFFYLYGLFIWQNITIFFYLVD